MQDCLIYICSSNLCDIMKIAIDVHWKSCGFLAIKPFRVTTKIRQPTNAVNLLF